MSNRSLRIHWLVFACLICACSGIISPWAAPSARRIAATPTYTRMPGGVLPNGLESPDIRGKIITVNWKNGRLLGIFVEESKEVDTKYDMASIGITEQTYIYRKFGDEIRLVPPDQLLEGMVVEAILYNTNDIYPVQARAWEILILSEEEEEE